MKMMPNTSNEFKRVALEILIGANVALALSNSNFEPAPPPSSHVTIHTRESRAATYVLPAARYDGLNAVEDTEHGTVKFVRWQGDKPRYDFNFKYNFVVTADGDNMFDKGSTYMPPELERDFDAVKKGFCHEHKNLADQPDHPMATYCASFIELAMKHE